MKKIITFLSAIVLTAGIAGAQDYKNAIGVRLGDGAGINYKHKMMNGNAFDIILDFSFFNSGSAYLTGLYEWYTPISSNGFSLYYGLGAHLGAFKETFALGIDGIIGVEYKFPNAPIALSLDYKPALNFLPDVDPFFNSFGFGIKYTF